MHKRFKRRYRLKKNVLVFNKVIIIFLLIMFMINNNFLKHFISNKADKYVKNNYIDFKKKLSMAINTETSKKDSIFTTKEDKNVEPIIYIYNTHQEEKYLSDNTLYKPGVLHASKYLNEQFNNSDLPSIVESRSITEVLNKNGWSYGSSYKVSRSYIEDTFQTHSSIKYFFDIHRDSGTHNQTTLCVDNKCYAKLLFLIGLENPTYYENQKYAEELNKRLNERVNGISKGILQKQGKKVNGIYNEDFSPRVILIEVGGENNTIDEVYNTLNVLSDILINYIKEEINYGK